MSVLRRLFAKLVDTARFLRSGPARLRALEERMGGLEGHFADWHAQLAAVVQTLTRKAATEDLRREADLLRDRLTALGEELERVRSMQPGVPAGRVSEGDAAAGPDRAGSSQASQAAAPGASAGALEQAFYLALERQFRGTREQIRERLVGYRPWFESLPRGPVADLGCGRGEWLGLLGEWGLEGQGVDLNALNVRALRDEGANAVCEDALEWLRRQPDSSLAAVTSFHLVEHLPFEILLQLIDQARRALVPGGRLLLETPNPENLLVATQSFWLDPTHRRPLPPSLLEFLAAYSGLEVEAVLRLNPPEGEDASVADPSLRRLLREGRDYAVIARRPGGPGQQPDPGPPEAGPG